VENSRGESAIYKLADLEGSIVLGGANRVVAAEHAWKGIIFGNNFPVVNKYQVGSVCNTPCETGAIVWLCHSVVVSRMYINEPLLFPLH